MRKISDTATETINAVATRAEQRAAVEQQVSSSGGLSRREMLLGAGALAFLSTLPSSTQAASENPTMRVAPALPEAKQIEILEKLAPYLTAFAVLQKDGSVTYTNQGFLIKGPPIPGAEVNHILVTARHALATPKTDSQGILTGYSPVENEMVLLGSIYDQMRRKLGVDTAEELRKSPGLIKPAAWVVPEDPYADRAYARLKSVCKRQLIEHRIRERNIRPDGSKAQPNDHDFIHLFEPDTMPLRVGDEVWIIALMVQEPGFKPYEVVQGVVRSRNKLDLRIDRPDIPFWREGEVYIEPKTPLKRGNTGALIVRLDGAGKPLLSGMGINVGRPERRFPGGNVVSLDVVIAMEATLIMRDIEKEQADLTKAANHKTCPWTPPAGSAKPTPPPAKMKK